ncbi:MFS transporter [Prauserella cavernicola]|uniref:MFS transporter n=1 Tax=Prauserella cavernicola TaxID=2800127 RepID=A0A934QVY8_9PSEU|nr:MFS transporter [Prauserella cavernicola]MBK1787536.1 MFS transporter [Prauserella cavernicola]
MDNDVPPPASAKLSKGTRRALIAAMTGTLIEWYDYALYGAAAAVVIGPLFFEGTETAATLAAFATFAVGFLARPLGGILIGHIGDRVGRKPALLLTIVLMGVATVGIGLLPTPATLGVLAPVLLVVLRLLQGMGAGAELAGAVTLVAEFAPSRSRGYLTSLVLATVPAGIVLATGAFLGVSALDDAVLLDWAWRVPFLASAVLFGLAVFIRQRLEETPEYVEAQRRAADQQDTKLPLVELLRRHRAAVAVGFFSITGHNALNYIMATFSLAYMTSSAVGMERSEALAAVTIGTVFGIIGTPVGGWAADRFGARRVLLFGSAAGALFAFPLFSALTTGDTVVATVALAIGYGVVIACTSGAQGAFLADLFPAEQRFSGIALVREFNGVLVAGTTPLVATALIAAFDGATWPAASFLTLCCVSSVAALLVWSRRRPAVAPLTTEATTTER